MTSPHSSSGRVKDSSGNPTGGIALIKNGLAFTASHVVNAALDIPLESRPRPSAEIPVSIDFPLAETGKLTAHVVKWQSPTDGDICALRVIGEHSSIEISSPLLTQSQSSEPLSVRSYGYPKGFPDGIWGRGQVQGVFANGRFQIHTAPSDGEQITLGYSGAPVWTEKDGFVGIVARAKSRRNLAEVISTSALFKFLEPQGLDGSRYTVAWLARHFRTGVLTAFLDDLHGAAALGIEVKTCDDVKECLALLANRLSGLEHTSEGDATWDRTPLDTFEKLRQRYTVWNSVDSKDGRTAELSKVLKLRRELSSQLQVALNPAIYQSQYEIDELMELFIPFEVLSSNNRNDFPNLFRKIRDLRKGVPEMVNQ